MLKLEISMPSRLSPKYSDTVAFVVKDRCNAYAVINELADLNREATFKIYNEADAEENEAG